MKYNRLGGTGLLVSELSLGSWLTYGKSVENKDASKIIQHAFHMGINSFDTANAYENGLAEVIVGKALKNIPREHYVLATKAYFPMSYLPNQSGLSRKHIIESLNASLKRLNTDYVDIFYCHRFDTKVPVLETLRAIDDMVRSGKVNYVGVSEWSGEQIEEAIKIADKYLLDKIVVNQPKYSMLDRRIETNVLPISDKYEIGQIVFSPLEQGLLTGKYYNNNVPKHSRITDPATNRWLIEKQKVGLFEKADMLYVIAKKHGYALNHVAINWVLKNKSISSCLIGCSSLDQLKDNVAAVNIKISDKCAKEIDNCLNEISKPGERFASV